MPWAGLQGKDRKGRADVSDGAGMGPGRAKRPRHWGQHTGIGVGGGGQYTFAGNSGKGLAGGGLRR